MKMWLCVCDCGNKTRVSTGDLNKGNSTSCGCLRRERTSEVSLTHGMSKSSTYGTWREMLQRCNNPNNQDFQHYGGRGIEVCGRWKKFENFLEDMGIRPEGLSLDRRNNNGNYELSNCRWATIEMQVQNRRAYLVRS